MERRPQFNLKRLLIVVTILAAGLAVAGPFIRQLSWEKQIDLLVLWTCVVVPTLVTALVFYLVEHGRGTTGWELRFSLGMQRSRVLWWCIGLLVIVAFLLFETHFTIMSTKGIALVHVVAKGGMCGIQLAMFLSSFLRQRYGVTFYDNGFCDSNQTARSWDQVNRFKMNKKLGQIVLFVKYSVLTVPLGDANPDDVEAFLETKVSA